MDLLNTSGFQRLERSVDAAALRQKVIANNVANIDTPYFKRSDVHFEELLQKELNAVKSPAFTAYKTHHKHISLDVGSQQQGVQPQVVSDQTSTMNNNQNNVDIDYEMSLLAKNQLYYNMMVQQVSYDIKHLRTAIGGRV
jgi:flagellar basal-body rod protein FlgB